MPDLPDLREAIYDAPLEERPWKAALASFRAALDARLVYMSFRPVQEGAVGIGIAAADADVSSMRRDYGQRYQHINPMPFEQMEQGKVYSIRDFVGEDHPFWTDYLTPSGVGNAYGFCISAGEFHAVIHLVRKAELGDLSPEQLRWWEAHTPAFTRAVRVFGHLRLSQFVAGLQAQVLDRMALGMMILNREAGVLYSNAAARQIVGTSGQIRISEDAQLRFARPEHQAMLRQSLANGTAPEPRLLCTIDPNTPERVVEVLLINIDPGHDFGLVSAPALVAYLHDRAASPAPPPEFLATLFDLTPAEARVLSGLAAGGAIAEVAQALDLSEHTVRTQTKRILAKIGVSRQTDLVRLAIGSLATLVGNLARD
ncbi:helix-turn-helix transcriptional regulator [Novosphingobium cyanobacteriorum]|uniref:Helix-turn-helix transcriptional regulator n=1 Tax=Novosphingobium cyanobacteriorum TaxID=3024215 RepID=A0ABT6CEM2_9SPHN|nr:helix-turn-helix transcriptional regulator [Novosphingobium cyanobacteriorum]MDF8331984.1 helix-turn-helix transcriptional regulator [Novosphingobium cyanobacteriorum]